MKRTNILLILFSIVLLANAQSKSDSLKLYLKDFQFNKAILWLDGQEKNRDNEFQKALCYKSLGENRKATIVLEALAEKYPKDIAVKKELAQCYEEAQKWRYSAWVYSKLMEIDSTNVYFAIKKAESELNDKNVESAKNDLIDMLQTDTLSSTLRLLAKSYELSNNLDTAAYYYGMGWGRDSLDVFFAANLVSTCLKKKEALAAYALSDKYIEKDTTNHQMNFLHGYSLYAMEEYEASRDALQKCFNKGDSSLAVNRTLGMSYYYTGDSDNSYKYLSKAYEQDTTNNVVLHHLAVSANDTKRYSEAVDYFSKVLYRLIPSQMQLYLNYRGLAIAYEQTAKYYEAAQCYEKALENATQDQTFYMLEPLAHIYYEHLDRKSDALHYYKQYRSTLDGKLLNMKHADDEVDHTEEIEKTSKQIADLDSFITEISRGDKKKSEDNSNDKSSERKTPESTLLFVVNGKVADTPSRNMAKMLSSKTIFRLDKALPEEQVYVEIAKEKGKTTVVLIAMEEEVSLIEEGALSQANDSIE